MNNVNNIGDFVPWTLRKIIDFLFSCEFTLGGVTVSFGSLMFYGIAFLIGARIIHVILNKWEDND